MLEDELATQRCLFSEYANKSSIGKVLNESSRTLELDTLS